MPKILISACLDGRPVRYDGQAKPLLDLRVEQWRGEGRLVSTCPELAGGFSTPRLPAEIENGMTGSDVLAGSAKVIDSAGADVTAAYMDGAQAALALARETGCAFALLIDGSPSCGSAKIHDGSFSGNKHAGAGVTAALLKQNGIAVFSHQELDALERALTGVRTDGR
ncbi:DUF523 domain-containing protein [Rhizobium sp. L1K21]|uniref:DUF523 domain-containing protein n=1 Tax=Rhizobium sp. L1K21 TaxID=2954933 RepID=UPI0020922CE4|nr:DUF523 domain-containing protein [Rhizobium sp. L1K21]MCO6186905.1 DUF523 domain-containing protein [Rhizobium sp. L1K21]